MCGIVGYIGQHQAYPILINGLKRLEYRGYDSAGIALLDDESDNARIKAELYNEMLNVAEQHFGSIICSIKALMEIPSVLPLPWDDRKHYGNKL